MTSKVERSSNGISWQLVSFFLAISFGVVGFAATKALLKLPDNASCNNISLWFTSATNRIYCAQLKAEKDTVEDLLAAIDLLEVMPDSHPLNHEFNRYIKDWSNDILDLAQKDLNQGKLEAAIAIARQIPQNEENKELIENKISRWEKTWAKGRKIEAQIEEELRESQWNKAFLVAVKLLNVNSYYWQEVRYQEMVITINLAREENKQLDSAYKSIKRGGLNSLLETIDVAGEISPESYSYNEAQKLIAQAEEELLEIAEDALDRQDWSDLSELANRISASSELKAQAIDWTKLARAGKNVELGTITGVELAITEAQQITNNSTVYAQAQSLITDWSQQKEDLAHLASARNLARTGEIGDLNAAIAKARLVRSGNTLYNEAQREIQSWQREIQVIEDTPILAQAKEFARNNTVQGWQSAINQANNISSNRVLYSEAQNLVREWRSNIQTVEDRPVLQQAIALGNSGNYQDAINVASKIGRGRSLYTESQRNIRKWRIEINAEQNLNTAYRIAKANDEQSLLRAINIARRIPSTSSVSFQARQATNLWSEQILNKAQRMADTYALNDIEKAIRIANMIPRGNSAYSRAQLKIEDWKRRLYPASNSNQSPLQQTNFN